MFDALDVLCSVWFFNNKPMTITSKLLCLISKLSLHL